jgi:hypothetical protein
MQWANENIRWTIKEIRWAKNGWEKQMNEYEDKLRDEWAKEGMDEQKKELMNKWRNGWAIVEMWWSNEGMRSAIEWMWWTIEGILSAIEEIQKQFKKSDGQLNGCDE